MKRRHMRVAAALTASICVSPAMAELIGVQPGLPLVFFDNQGVTEYDASEDHFTVQATPSAIRFSSSEPPVFIDPTGEPSSRSVQISIFVDSAGNLIGGDPTGPDLIIIGEASDGKNDYSGILLTGEILEFGFLDTTINPENSLGRLVTDIYDFRFAPSGGALAPFYEASDIGVFLSSEMSSFMNSFQQDFGGEAKGTCGPIPLPAGGACCFGNGFCLEDLPPTSARTWAASSRAAQPCAPRSSASHPKAPAALTMAPAAC